MLIACLVSFTSPALAEDAAGSAAAASPVKVGLYVTQLHDLDMAKRSFTVSYWGWFLSSRLDYDPIKSVEIVNAKNFSVKFASSMVRPSVPWLDGEITDLLWTQGKYDAIVAQDWNLTKFPFDEQTLIINLEDSLNDATGITLVPDSTNSLILDTLRIPGWSVGPLTLRSVDMVYGTTYGDPELSGTSTYSRVIAEIKVKRHGTNILGSLFIGYFVAFIMVALAFIPDIRDLVGARIGLATAAIFSAIGNKYTIDSFLPPSSDFRLADCVALTTFGAIVASILVTLTLHFLSRRYPNVVQRTNAAAAVTVIGMYVVTNGWFIVWAMGTTAAMG